MNGCSAWVLWNCSQDADMYIHGQWRAGRIVLGVGIGIGIIMAKSPHSGWAGMDREDYRTWAMGG